MPTGNWKSSFHKVETHAPSPFLAHLCRRLLLDICKGMREPTVQDHCQGARAIYTCSGLPKDKNPMSNLVVYYQLTTSVLLGFATSLFLKIVNRFIHWESRLHIYIVWELSYRVQLDLKSDSNKFSFLIIILTCYNRVSYPDITIGLFIGLGTL
jgi:hypothetical protein